MPYMKDGKRDYGREYKEYHSREESKSDRAARNKGRRILESAGLVHKGDGKDVDHKRALSKGGSDERSNLRVASRGSNRSFSRNADGSMKSQRSRRGR